MFWLNLSFKIEHNNCRFPSAFLDVIEVQYYLRRAKTVASKYSTNDKLSKKKRETLWILHVVLNACVYPGDKDRSMLNKHRYRRSSTKTDIYTLAIIQCNDGVTTLRHRYARVFFGARMNRLKLTFSPSALFSFFCLLSSKRNGWPDLRQPGASSRNAKSTRRALRDSSTTRHSHKADLRFRIYSCFGGSNWLDIMQP